MAWDFKAISQVETRTGLSMLNGEVWQVFAATAKPAETKATPEPTAKASPARVLSILFFAAILAHHPEYDSEEGLAAVGSYIDMNNSEQISAAVSDAYVASLPKAERERIQNREAGGEEVPLASQPAAQAASAGSSAGVLAGSISDSPIMKLDV